MRLFLLLLGTASLYGCSVFSTLDVNRKLIETKQQIVHCQFESALDTLQQYTVIGNSDEKTFAFEYMGVIYQDSKEYKEFDHTVDRFMFSKAGKERQREHVIEQWHKTLQEIRHQRVYETGVTECIKEAKPGLI